MAFQQTGAMTLTDWAKRQDPDGKSASIVEMLSQTNEVLQDMMFVEGNLPTGHRTTVRTGLPAVAWRMLNYGVPQGKATTAQVTDTVGMLEAFSSVDKDLVELSGNHNEFRLSESRAFLEAMNQEMARTVFYGDTDLEPEKFLGLSPRYSDLSAESGENIVDAGGSTAAGTRPIGRGGGAHPRACRTPAALRRSGWRAGRRVRGRVGGRSYRAGLRTPG